MPSEALNVTGARSMADLLELPRSIRRPTPVNTAERALIDRYIAAGRVNHVPRGVSGEDDEQTANRLSWTGHRFPQSAEFRHKQAKRRQLYRRLVDDGKTGREIAEAVGLKLESVYGALSRLRLKIRPTFVEPRDG